MLKDPQARILSKRTWPGYVLLTISSPRIAAQAQPGQFLMIRVHDGLQPLLRRPFSIHAAAADTVTVFFQTVGPGTALLAEKPEGEGLDIIGPLGKGFGIRSNLNSAVLVGGGRGIAPLVFLARRLRAENSGVRIFYGGRSAADLPLREDLADEGFELFCSTDDGSFASAGLITDRLEQEWDSASPEILYACGPEAMLREVGEIASRRQIPAELSLESYMGCGFGACWGCVHRIKDSRAESWKKVCEEGPVFPAHEIVWMDREP